MSFNLRLVLPSTVTVRKVKQATNQLLNISTTRSISVQTSTEPSATSSAHCFTIVINISMSLIPIEHWTMAMTPCSPTVHRRNACSFPVLSCTYASMEYQEVDETTSKCTATRQIRSHASAFMFLLHIIAQ